MTPSQHSAQPLRLRVGRRSAASATVAAFELESEDGSALPTWEPGAHVDVLLGNGLERQYSLSGDPADRGRYRLGVLREPNGTGGSAWMHDEVHEGDVLTVSRPQNHFTLVPAPSYRFIAGGVGITPVLPMLRAAEQAGADWHLTYVGRSRSSMAFLDEVTAWGDRVTVHADDEDGPVSVAALVGPLDPGRLVYACGPGGLLTAIEAELGPAAASVLHIERFAPKDPGVLEEAGDAFDVVLTRSACTLRVLPGVSILSTVEAAGIIADYSCREGTCGTCETAIVAGLADHRDSILSEAERQANESLMICVSRSRTPALELEL